MERINNSLNNMRDGHGVGRSQLGAASNTTTNNYYGRDMLGRFAWPPRPYTCSFCKREFRSAQALGGHMNVHRRDRARLRQSSPSDDHHQAALNQLSPNPNPNFNYSSSPSCSSSSAYTKNQLSSAVLFTHNFPPFSSTTPSITLSNSSPSADHEPKIPTMFCSSFDPSSSRNEQQGNFAKKTTVKTYFEVGELKGFIHEDNDDHDQYYCKNLKKGDNNIVTLDLEIGLSSKDDLDLELRLGYSN